MTPTTTTAKSSPYFLTFEKGPHRFVYLFNTEDLPAIIGAVVEQGRQPEIPLTWVDVKEVVEALEGVFKVSAGSPQE